MGIISGIFTILGDNTTDVIIFLFINRFNFAAYLLFTYAIRMTSFTELKNTNRLQCKMYRVTPTIGIWSAHQGRLYLDTNQDRRLLGR